MNLRELENFVQQEHSSNASMFDVIQAIMVKTSGEYLIMKEGLLNDIAAIKESTANEIAALRELAASQRTMIKEATAQCDRYKNQYQNLDHWVAELRTITHQLREDVDMMWLDIEDFGFDYEMHLSQEHAGLAAKIEILEEKVGSRNKSAAVKRNMTDDDARRVLNGDQKDINHKEAGSNIGLTYAQVYSCRMEFTFKHVHKELRDSGWKNPWKQ